MAPRKNLVAVTPGGDITAEMLAGEYTWFSISEDMISLTKARKAFKDAGLDPDRLPKGRRPEHVVQEACRKAERVIQNGRREEIRAEQVDRVGAMVTYQITRHIQDKEHRVIDHPKALRVTFHPASEELQFEPLESTTRSEVAALIDEIQGYFDKNRALIPGHKLRTIIRHYIEDVGGENMRGRSGGVYFLAKRLPLYTPMEFDGEEVKELDGQVFLDRIVAVLDALYKAPEIHRVPCINDEGQRAWLERKFVENCSEDLREYTDELIELVRDDGERAFRKDMVNNLLDRRDAMTARIDKFRGILGHELTALDRNLKLADQALSKFVQSDRAKPAVEARDAA